MQIPSISILREVVRVKAGRCTQAGRSNRWKQSRRANSDVIYLNRNRQQLGEPAFHLVRVPQGKIAEDQIKARLKVGASAHDGLIRWNGILKLTQPHKGIADIAENLKANFLSCVGDLRGRTTHP